MVEITSGKNRMIIAIDSYQYSQEKSKPGDFNYDANWLDVAVTFSDNGDVTRYVDPCLLTTELAEIPEELERVMSGEEDSYISDFLEPYLSIVFARDGERIVVIVHFVYDTTGRWKSRKITKFMSAEEADDFLRRFKAMCAEFPQR